MKTVSIFYFLIFNFFSVINFQCASNSLRENDIAISNFGVKSDEKINGYFDGDNLEDYILITNDENKSDKIILLIFINNGKGYSKKGTLEITNDDFESVENPLQNFFISNPKKGEILVGASCCGNFKTTESGYYKFFKEIDSWILYKITKATVNSDFIPDIEIEYQDFSYSVDGKTRNNELIREKELKLEKEEGKSQFNALFSKYKTANATKVINNIKVDLNFDDLAKMVTNFSINKENINNYNDLAYYLSLTKNGKLASIFLLRKIIENDPSRIVAYLNLADSQWDLENRETASKNYQKYISLMKSNNKDLKKIPTRAIERAKLN